MSELSADAVRRHLEEEPEHGGKLLEMNMTSVVSLHNLDQFLNLDTLTHLNMAVNLLKSVEEIFVFCENLVILDLSINHISKVIDNIYTAFL